jgi:glycosyltransferase involved in cell wall biosynthesis
MSASLYIFDPTVTDEASRVRGIGRYMQILHEYAPENTTFVSSIDEVPYESTFVYPFFNFLSKPLSFRRIARYQIAVIHDLIPFKYPKQFPIGFKGFLSTIANRIDLRNYDKIITDSEASKQDIIAMLESSPEIINIVYPPMLSDFQKRVQGEIAGVAKESLPKGPYCIYVGDVTWNKNLVNLAKAIKIADIRCVFVGKHFIKSKMNIALVNKQKAPNPWLDELYGFYEEVQNDDRFLFHGFVTDDYLVSLYKSAVCNILTSRDEGFGLSFLEAATCGVPSVLGDIPVFHEIAGNSAMFANPENPIEIADKIRRMYDEKERTKLVKGLKDQTQLFSGNKFRSEFERVVSRGNTH